MMYNHNIPTSLLEESSSTIVYIQNRIPQNILEEKTPKEVFTCEKTKVGHLNILGCPIEFHVPKEKRTKMEPSESERHICWIQRILQSLQNLCSRTKTH